MKDFDIIQNWLYEDGEKPFSVQPETYLFDVIMDVTEGESPIEIANDLESGNMPMEAIERFKDYFINKITKEGTLKEILFGV